MRTRHHMGTLKVGSDEHKTLFCREFVATHHAYEPRAIAWPDLDEPSLARVRGLPFWGEAVGSERTAAARVRAMAEAEPDPVLREPIAMQAYEEARHAQLLDSMLRRYRIPFQDTAAEEPRDPEWGFVRMGYGECFDSFFAFGLFKLAHETAFFPPSIVQIFDGVLQEEARHILFFANWAAHRSRRLPAVRKPRFVVRRALGMALQVLGRMQTALQLHGSDQGDNFTMEAPHAIGVDVSLRGLAATCLRENERRLACYDERLLRPVMVPRLVRAAVRFMPGGR